MFAGGNTRRLHQDATIRYAALLACGALLAAAYLHRRLARAGER